VEKNTDLDPDSAAAAESAKPWLSEDVVAEPGRGLTQLYQCQPSRYSRRRTIFRVLAAESVLSFAMLARTSG
jgi:hypothetical protein